VSTEASRDTRFVATTLADAHAGPSWHTEMVTQMTNGVEVDVLEEQGEWCRVRQRDGYESWVYAAYLVKGAPPEPTHIVAAQTLRLYASARKGYELDFPASRLPMGTRIVVDDQDGDWLHVRPAGDLVPAGWAHATAFHGLGPLRDDLVRGRIVRLAHNLVGVFYLWGGCTAWGIDCSGLAQLTHRLAGITLLRDARMQFTQGRPVEEPFRSGDLIFFSGETDRAKITHVGISTGGWRMIHSSRSRNGVYEEDLAADTDAMRKLRARVAGARSMID
jgi:SH3-like domain-containing protein